MRTPNVRTAVWLSALCLISACAAWFVVRFLPSDGVWTMPSSLLPKSIRSAEKIIFRSGEETIDCRKKGNAWFVFRDGIPYRADSARLSLVLEALSGESVRDRINARQQRGRNLELGDFGLSEPRIVVEVHLANERTVRVLIGSNALYDDTVFAKTDRSPDVYVVGGVIRDLVPESFEEIRDKSVFPHLPDTVVRIDIKRYAGIISLVKRKNGWYLTSPVSAAADNAAVHKILRAMSTATVGTFVINIRPSALSDIDNMLFPYGLNHSDAATTVSVWTDGMQSPVIYIFGRPAPNSPDSVFTYSSEENSVFTSAASFMNAFSADAESLRDHSIFRTSGREMHAIGMRTAKSSMNIERGDGGAWSFTKPSPQPADAAAVERYISTLEAIRDSGISAEPIPDKTPPAALLSAVTEDGEEWNAQIFESGESGVLLIKTDADKFARKIEEGNLPGSFFTAGYFAGLRDMSVISIRPDDVISVTQKRRGLASVSAIRIPAGGWTCPVENAAANGAHIDSALETMRSLRAGEVDVLVSDDDTVRGLNPPECEFAVTVDSDTFSDAVLQFGAKTDNGASRLVRRKGFDAVFKIPEETASVFMLPICSGNEGLKDL